jgi:hypothetical protein
LTFVNKYGIIINEKGGTEMKWYIIAGIILTGLILQGYTTRTCCPGSYYMPASRYYVQAQATPQQGGNPPAQQPQTNPGARQGTNPAQGCPIQWQVTGAVPTGNGGAIQFGFNSNGQWSVNFSFGGQVGTGQSAS